MSGSGQTPFPLGAMVGGPNGSDASAQAAFNAAFSAFTSLMGAAPTFMDGFIDQAQPIAQWASNASWTAWSWKQSAAGASVTPVIGLPMVSTADASNPDAVYKAFAAGQYDEVLRGIVSAWAQQGYTNLYFRPGYEMNGTFMPWYAGSDAGTQSDWVAAFQHIADVLHASTDATVKVVWNPNAQSWNGNLNVASLYPGDRYVDVIAADLYSPVYPRDYYDWVSNDGTVDATFTQWASVAANREHYWDYPAANRWGYLNDGQGNSFSLQDLIDLAKAHGKPVALAETGAGGDGTRGPADDPAFPQWLAGKLSAAGVPIAFVNIWNLNAGDADWTFSGAGASRPQEAAAWAKYFGAQTAAAAPSSSALVLGSGPDTISLTLSEDAWQGNAQYTVSVDGIQFGGMQTAAASHAAGLSQAVTLLGSFAGQPHDVAVTFLNDAYAGTADTDRNLYVGSVMSAGAISGGAALMSAGTSHFHLGATTPTQAGSGPDQIVLAMSEDEWQGDAQFTVAVDGTPVGSSLVATASHASGQEQYFTFKGSFGAGPHRVTVDFLNDAYGGTAATDRNLHVDSIIAGGTTTITQAALMSAGPATFLLPAAGSLAATGSDGGTVSTDVTAAFTVPPASPVLAAVADPASGDAALLAYPAPDLSTLIPVS